ncbi:MAG: hypothetical protein ACOYJJ_06940 [Anaerovoracaceae bacterium]|jgi:DNA polymerase-3 subunit delta'
MALSEYRKYGVAVEQAEKMIRSGRVPHGILVEGGPGVDRVGFARAFAAALLCREKPGEGCGICPVCRQIADGNYTDLMIIVPEEKSGSRTGVRSIRDENVIEMQEWLAVLPSQGDRKIAVIDHAEQMTARAETRLLKTLEEPEPGTVILILCENPEALLPTVRSRLMTLRLPDLGEPDTEKDREAAELLEMAVQHAFFFDIRNRLEEAAANKGEALQLVDAMEGRLGRMMRRADSEDSLLWIAGAVRLTETARSEITRNASYRYVLRSLMLKLEESIK